MMMEIDPPTHFLTKDDEVRYWMDIAQQMYDRNKDIELELEEFQENSHILEKELETSYWESDKKNRDLNQENSRLLTDNEELRMKFNQLSAAYNVLQEEFQNVRTHSLQLQRYIRELEQKNDDLERSNRENQVSKDEMETQYYELVERFALLETEVEERQRSEVIIQRLKDENKELKQQIEVDLRKRFSIQEERITSEISNVNKRFSDIGHNDELNKSQRRPSIQGSTLWQRAHILSFRARKKIEDNDKFRISQTKFDKRVISQDVQVRIKDKATSRSRPHSLVGKLQDDKERNSPISSRNIETRIKKVKDEEKRQQNLTSFLRRLRRKD